MKNKIYIISLLLFLISYRANSEHFTCDLSLNLIENSASSQAKKLVLDVELRSDGSNSMSGTVITSSCFNTIYEPFKSDVIDYKQNTIGDFVEGTFRALNLSIGNYRIYHYQLDLKFFKTISGDPNDSFIHFLATGTMLPLDEDDHFIHQNIEGECTLSSEVYFPVEQV